jgi:MFS family permease
VAVWTVGEIGTAGSFQALITALAPAHLRGRYAGALGLAWGASGLISPLLGASAYSVSPTLLWLGCLAAGLLAGAGQFWLLGQVDRRTASDVEA